MFSLFDVILVLGVVQGIIIALLLFKNKRALNIFLGLLILNIAIDLFATLLGTGHWFDRYPSLYFIPVYYNLGYGPIIYFAAVSFVKPDFRVKKIHYINFLPVVSQGTFYWVSFWLSLKAKGIIYRGIWMSLVWPIEHYGTMLSVTIYLALAFSYIIKYRSVIIASGSFGQAFYFTARFVLCIFAFLLLFWVAGPQLLNALHINTRISIFDVLMSSVIYLLGFTVLRYNDLINKTRLEIIYNKDVQKIESGRYPLLTAIQLKKIIEDLNDLMEVQKLYKNPDLTLKSLADQLHTNVNIVSYAINSGMDTSFNNLINSYRVKEVQSQINNTENDYLTLLGIAYNCGFNSKSSFNLIFKQHTGYTPKAYKNKTRALTAAS